METLALPSVRAYSIESSCARGRFVPHGLFMQVTAAFSERVGSESNPSWSRLVNHLFAHLPVPRFQFANPSFSPDWRGLASNYEIDDIHKQYNNKITNPHPWII